MQVLGKRETRNYEFHEIVQSIFCLAALALFVELSLAGGLQNRSAGSAPLHRVAVVSFIGAHGQAVESTLARSLATDERAILIEQAQIKPALSGLGYDASINLRLEDAKHLGAAIGCDFFIIGKADAAIRSEAANESHAEALIAVF